VFSISVCPEIVGLLRILHCFLQNISPFTTPPHHTGMDDSLGSARTREFDITAEHELSRHQRRGSRDRDRFSPFRE
jgi:hypothetical protein